MPAKIEPQSGTMAQVSSGPRKLLCNTRFEIMARRPASIANLQVVTEEQLAAPASTVMAGHSRVELPTSLVVLDLSSARFDLVGSTHSKSTRALRSPCCRHMTARFRRMQPDTFPLGAGACLDSSYPRNTFMVSTYTVSHLPWCDTGRRGATTRECREAVSTGLAATHVGVRPSDVVTHRTSSCKFSGNVSIHAQ